MVHKIYKYNMKVHSKKQKKKKKPKKTQKNKQNKKTKKKKQQKKKQQKTRNTHTLGSMPFWRRIIRYYLGCTTYKYKAYIS